MKNPFIPKLALLAGCVLSGWIAAFAMPQVSFWPCLFIGLSLFYWIYNRLQGAGTVFLGGLCFALGYFVTGLWWIGNALLVEGNEFAWVWPISVIGLPTLLGLFVGTYLAIAKMLAPSHTLKGFFAFVFFLTFSDWARGHAFTGFPWNLYGYVWSDHIVMAQIAHSIGAYGLTFLSVAWASLGGFLLTQKRTPRFYVLSIGLALLTLGVTYLYGDHRLKNNPTEFDTANMVVVVQPNIAQNMKWDPQAIQDNFLKTLRLSQDATLTAPSPSNIFFIWPETAISPSIYNDPSNMERMRLLLEHYNTNKTNAYLITGVLRRTQNNDGTLGAANSVIFLNSHMSAIDVYDKHHLVPFGEFIPLQQWIPLKPVAAFHGFDRGKGATTITREGIPAFSPLICYEVIFPDDVLPKRGSRAQWMVNVTNDGWYGNSAGPHQHFAQTRMRAIEEGVPLIRSANTGISGIIDSYGRTIRQAGIFEDSILVSPLPKPISAGSLHWSWGVQVLFAIFAIPLILFTLVLRK